MFNIQYKAVNGERKMQAFDSTSRQRLVAHLARFEHPITDVYEQASPITKTVRSELQTWPGTLSRCAREFAFTTPV